MSNYITIESGYFEPFKENETDQELMELADNYSKIKKDIQEVFLKYCHSEEYLDKHSGGFYDCLSELEEELRKCLLHRSWICEKSILINESNIVNVEYLRDVECKRGKQDILKIRTGVWTTKVMDLKDCFDEDQRRFIDQIKQAKPKGVEESICCYEDDDNHALDYWDYHLNEFAKIFLRCSIVETYKDFQSNNIEKIKKDKIRCGSFETVNEMDGIFYCNA